MITCKELENEVRRLSTAYPDAVYTNVGSAGCCYSRGLVYNGPEKCGCIFGQSLSNLGIDPAQFDDQIDFGYNKCALGIIKVMKNLGLNASTEFEDWCEAVQGNQDSECTWSQSVLKADEVYGNDYF